MEGVLDEITVVSTGRGSALMMGLIIRARLLLLLRCAWIVVLQPNDRAGSAGEAPGRRGGVEAPWRSERSNKVPHKTQFT